LPALSSAHIAFGDTLRAAREARSWSQEELAQRAGLHRNQVGYLERAERNAGLSAVLALAEALDTTAADLMRPAEHAFRKVIARHDR